MRFLKSPLLLIKFSHTKINKFKSIAFLFLKERHQFHSMKGSKLA